MLIKKARGGTAPDQIVVCNVSLPGSQMMPKTSAVRKAKDTITNATFSLVCSSMVRYSVQLRLN